MSDYQAHPSETLTHRLVLPRDANHHGTLYAGALLALALEAGYASAFRAAGLNANLVLKRVLDLREMVTQVANRSLPHVIYFSITWALRQEPDIEQPARPDRP